MSKARDLTTLLSTDGDVKLDRLGDVALNASESVSEFVASGTLPDGAVVILNADGTVSEIAGEVIGGTTVTIPVTLSGTDNVGAVVALNSVAMDVNTHGRFMVARNGELILGTISGSTITFGAPTVVTGMNYPELICLSGVTDKFVVLYYTGPTLLLEVTVVGTTITIGTPYEVGSGANHLWYFSIADDPHTPGQFAYSGMSGANANASIVRMGTLSGGVFTLGTAAIANADGSNETRLIFDPVNAGTLVSAYTASYSAAHPITYPTISVATHTGTTITAVGTPVVYSSNRMNTSTFSEMAFHPTVSGQLIVIGKTSAGHTAVLGTITGTSIAISDYYIFDAGTNEAQTEFGIAFSGVSDDFLIAYKNYAATDAVVLRGSLVGGVLSWHETTTFAVGGSGSSDSRISLNFVPGDPTSFVLNHLAPSNTSEHAATIGTLEATASTTANLTETNFLGTSSGTYTDGQTANIVLRGGVSTNQTGLTTGETYYIQNDGSLGLEPDVVYAIAGKAISATSLQLSTEVVADNTDGTRFIASGTLPNGVPVVLKADGTVEAVGVTVTYSVTGPMTTGSEVIFYGSTASYVSIAFDPNTAGKFVITYMDWLTNAGYGMAMVGTVSGTTMTFGAPVVFNASSTTYINIAFDPNTAGQFVITYKAAGNSDYGTAIVGTLSGTTLSFGSGVVFGNDAATYVSMSFDPNTAGKFVITYYDNGNSGYGTAIVGTVSGTSISFGAEYVFNSSSTSFVSISFDPNTAGQFVIAYRDDINSYYGTAIVGTVSGTAISFGLAVVFNSYIISDTAIAFDPNAPGRFVIAYWDSGNTNDSLAIVGTLSGTTMTFGTSVAYSADALNRTTISFDPNVEGLCVISGHMILGDTGIAVVGTVVGTAISFATGVLFSASGGPDYPAIAFDPNTVSQFVIAYSAAEASNFGKVVLGSSGVQPVTTTTNLTETNFLGLANAAYSDGDAATITLQGGISTSQTGLTIGTEYYVQEAGGIGITADTISVVAGKPLSTTSLLIASYGTPATQSESTIPGSGGTQTSVGGYMYHTFTSSGTFVPPTGGLPDSYEYLIVAGGGGGGTQNTGANNGGGGGAGGYLSGTFTDGGNRTIVIGAGGSIDTNGVDSSIQTVANAALGGGAGGQNFAGSDGGSGGGSGAIVGGSALGGSGTAGQGNDGGVGNESGGNYVGGGGGGAGADGTDGIGNQGHGGAGLEWQGLATYYAGGGGGAGNAGNYGTGGVGGGGRGGTNVVNSAVAGTVNTGGGGGAAGASVDAAAAGGSGIVIIRYAI
jgi:hypothetical protein